MRIYNRILKKCLNLGIIGRQCADSKSANQQSATGLHTTIFLSLWVQNGSGPVSRYTEFYTCTQIFCWIHIPATISSGVRSNKYLVSFSVFTLGYIPGLGVIKYCCLVVHYSGNILLLINEQTRSALGLNQTNKIILNN